MAISSVKKLGIIVLRNKKEELIKKLHSFGYVEIIKPEKNENLSLNTLQDLNSNLGEIEEALSHISKYQKNGGLKALLAGRKEISLSDLTQEASNFTTNVISKIGELKNNIKENETLIGNCKTEIDKYKSWTFTNISKSDFEHLNHTIVYFLSGKTDCFLKLKEELAKNSISTELCINEDKNIVHAILFSLKKDNEDIFSLISACGASIEEPDLNESASLKIKNLEDKILEYSNNIQKNNEEIKQLSEYYEKMTLYSDHLLILRDEMEVENNFCYTTYSAFIKVWISEKHIEKFKDILEKEIKQIQITEICIEENEKPPVILEGNGFTSPFQAITTMYGTPGKGEFDPTPWFAPFFVLFFGFCLSDAGYGIVVLLLAISGLMLKDIDRDIKKGLKLMGYCGISTIIMGALFGSWFGWTPQSESFLGSLQVIDPNADALLLMKISLLLGTIQIIWSKILAAAKAFMHKDFLGVIEEILWSVYLVSFFMSAGKYVGFVKGSSWYYPFFGYMAGSVVIINLIKSKANILLRPFQSILKLYDTIGFFGDALSYSRLMALALATGGVALAINVVADLAITLIPVPGVNFVVKILILIFGHSFNIIINVLGAFIHSMRLQFVEFFQKFFDGGGSIFKPFKINTKHIRLIKELD